MINKIHLCIKKCWMSSLHPTLAILPLGSAAFLRSVGAQAQAETIENIVLTKVVEYKKKRVL